MAGAGKLVKSNRKAGGFRNRSSAVGAGFRQIPENPRIQKMADELGGRSRLRGEPRPARPA